MPINPGNDSRKTINSYIHERVKKAVYKYHNNITITLIIVTLIITILDQIKIWQAPAVLDYLPSCSCRNTMSFYMYKRLVSQEQ